MAYYNRIYLVLAALLQVIDSLSNLVVRIPEHIQEGESADLTCSFNLGGDKLYSVKWYKGRHEFYRFMPHEVPKVKIFPVKGMKINLTASDQTRAVIDDVQINHSGTYMCEVTVTPTFFALMQFANMTVINFPSEGPSIHSKRKQYQVGETADLICTAQNSSPSTQLSWYINGEPANEAYLRLFPTARDGSQKLGLSFPLSFNHFVMPHGNRVRLKCLASISDFYWKSAEITLLQEKPKFASVMTNGEGNSPSSDSSAGAFSPTEVRKGGNEEGMNQIATVASKTTRLPPTSQTLLQLALLLLSSKYREHSSC